MEIKINESSKFINILSRMKRELYIRQGIYLIIRLYLTNNIFYYILCVLFRFIPLLIVSGNYVNMKINTSITNQNNNSQSFQEFLKLLTIHNLIEKLNFSVNLYIFICILLYILFIIRIIIYYYIIKIYKDDNQVNELPSPPKFQIIIDHIVFLIFPYIIEYLSFSFYIYFFPNKFIIKLNNFKIIIILIMILNTFLIFLYNLNNFIFIIYSNKLYTTSNFEAYLRINNEKKYINNKTVFYKISNIAFYILIFLQNFSLFNGLELYLENSNKIYYKI